MAIYASSYTDCGLASLASYAPKITCTLSEEAYRLDTGGMLSCRPVAAILAADGSFTVDLVPNDRIAGNTFYYVKATYLDETGGMAQIDLFKVYARTGSGTLIDMAIPGSWAPAYLIVSDYQPNPWPVGWVWASELTGDVNRRTA
ncbi:MULTISPECIES: hypothetical protein [unclassified Cryobacterium]|uniref:hypothetical protein n=1 Tax=unclassified Cryobacterium TaxID=2649013 RepID=UPI0010691373|nr:MULTISPECIES: hypothetical protein [unclassified Cryobacterium]TFC59400.1 hypothetical protein E3O68_00430 [Cryobacterium sp. TMB3-1-2]TFC67196.1 hypothetical protein E3T21_17125 [Cryobacterium sp. TMB3-15]TFC73291.1 hypothetical protein E3T22_16930 [Cryobacterium sp. TMB3-10]TFD46179.1 hypothetical protein E3T58_01565 [Cryobacterium sp. TMB3-12]